MGRVSNWLHEHDFHHEGKVRFKDTQKTKWETVLLIILVAMIIFTVIVLMTPYQAY